MSGLITDPGRTAGVKAQSRESKEVLSFTDHVGWVGGGGCKCSALYLSIILSG